MQEGFHFLPRKGASAETRTIGCTYFFGISRLDKSMKALRRGADGVETELTREKTAGKGKFVAQWQVSLTEGRGCSKLKATACAVYE